MKLRFAQIDEFLDATESVLNASIYKNNNRFRNDKAFKGLKMIKRTVERLKDLQFKSCLNQFSEHLPLASDVKKSKNDLYLPSRPILQHFLGCHIKVFLQAKKLLCLCEYTSAYLQARIKLGHFWNWALFNFANVSRLWTLAQSMLVYLHLSYSELQKLMPICIETNNSWLPEGVEFPRELFETKSVLREKDTIKQLLASNDVPVFEVKQPNVLTITIGEEIEREPTPSSTSNKEQSVPEIESTFNRKHWLKLKTKVDKLKSPEDIKTFLKCETDERHGCRKKAITKKMQQSDWKLLKTATKKSLSDGLSVENIKKTMISWIICPKHQGKFCKEVKAIK